VVMDGNGARARARARECMGSWTWDEWIIMFANVETGKCDARAVARDGGVARTRDGWGGVEGFRSCARATGSTDDEARAITE